MITYKSTNTWKTWQFSKHFQGPAFLLQLKIAVKMNPYIIINVPMQDQLLFNFHRNNTWERSFNIFAKRSVHPHGFADLLNVPEFIMFGKCNDSWPCKGTLGIRCNCAMSRRYTRHSWLFRFFFFGGGGGLGELIFSVIFYLWVTAFFCSYSINYDFPIRFPSFPLGVAKMIVSHRTDFIS